MIFLGGLSGAGKTTLSREIVAIRPDLRAVRGSAILAEYNQPLGHLTRTSAEQNQEILIRWLERQPSTSNIIFDGHAVLPIVDEPFVYKVPLLFFRKLRPAAVVWISAEPKRLLAKRNWPDRFQTEADISGLQIQEGAHLRTMSTEVGAAFVQICSDNSQTLKLGLERLLDSQPLKTRS